MKLQIVRVIVASALALAPIAAFATTPVISHDHTPVAHSHEPVAHGHPAATGHTPVAHR